MQHSINLLDGITFVALNQTAVNTTLLKIKLPNAAFIMWDIHTEPEPKSWKEELWEGFGCSMLFIFCIELKFWF